ncbi:uncharacterized protein LDX57_011991 [Aspergillus melleus]|uniref:uncharacterized protein n=1 Tax=Aspergillus melleus TaxID=138277 RepID=UPI001E8E21E1|nr:uncharacterized protein LDX57_011991 [Aspergillus melleus]KAH8434342.1 hypothetical protein LDX57_011991 [Aspergillus melleus]
MAAARAMLDEEHGKLPQPLSDNNSYALGEIRGHNVVIACLPSGVYGTTSASFVASQMLSTFPSVRFGLMVGVGGGVPGNGFDIRLGDVVVSKPQGGFGGVVQYDHGKTVADGGFERTGMLNKPPAVLLTAISALETEHLMGSGQVQEFLSQIRAKFPHVFDFVHGDQRKDILFDADYDHTGAETCESCDEARQVHRSLRATSAPRIHYGLIASGNQVMKHGGSRDRLARELGIICFEMEAAGLMDQFPCLIIRGICDYADSHKTKEWQGYAASTAAAYAKELLSVVSVPLTENTRRASEVLHLEKYRIPFNMKNIPLSINFLGRDTELDRLRQILDYENANMRKIAVLHGMGGIGKTQMAIQFSRIHKGDYTSIFWLNGKDRGALIRSLAMNAPRIPKDQLRCTIDTPKNEVEEERLAQEVLKWFSIEGNSKWLLIFDNVDKYSSSEVPRDSDAYDIGEFFPIADQGFIVITTRLNQLTEIGTPLRIEKLAPEMAFELLQRCSGYRGLVFGGSVSGQGPSSDIKRLLARLDGLPLAIVIAGSFMRRTGMPLSKYLRHYEDSWYSLQTGSEPRLGYDHGNMITAWTISYYEIKKRSHKAAFLLRVFSYLSNHDIWFELVQSAAKSLEIPTWFRESVSDEISFSRIIQHLVEFSMIQTQETGKCYSIHPVIQDWCQNIPSTSERETADHVHQLKKVSLVSIGFCIPPSTEPEYWVLQQRLLAHADAARQIVKRDKEFLLDREVLYSMLKIADLYSDQDRLEDAESMYNIALVGYESVLGSHHPDTLHTVDNLACLYRQRARFTEAEIAYQRTLEGYRHTVGAEHKLTLGTANNLGLLFKDQGKLIEAAAIFEETLLGFERSVGPRDLFTLILVTNLAITYQSQGKLTDAARLHQRALDGFEKSLGSNHPNTLHVVNNLGINLRHRGKFADAEKMYRRAFDGYTNVLGPDHTDTLMAANNLGVLFNYQGKLQMAEEMIQYVLAARMRKVGAEHADTLTSMSSLGSIYQDEDKLNEADEVLLGALSGREVALGPSHEATLSIVNKLGFVYKYQGRLTEAIEMHQRALDGYKAYSLAHVGYLEALGGLGEIYCLRGDLDEGEAMYQAALSSLGSEKAFSNDSSSIMLVELRTRHRLANLHRDKGHLDKAETGYRQVIAELEMEIGAQHKDTPEAVDDLGVLFVRSGRLHEAQTMFDRAFQGFEENLGPQHTYTLRTVLHLGNIHARRRKFTEAGILYSQVLEGLQAKHGTSHYLYLQALSDSANILKLQGRKEEAAATYYQLLNSRERIYGSEHPETLKVFTNLHELQRAPPGYINCNQAILLSGSLFLLILFLFGNLELSSLGQWGFLE